MSIFQRALTKEQELEVCELYYEEQLTQVKIAARYGVHVSTISRIVNKVEYMNDFLKRTTACRVRAQCRINRALSEAADKQIELMRGDYEDQYKYLSQNAARDILDRGGVRAEKEEKPETKVVFNFGDGDGFTLGVPDHSADEPDENVLPEEV